MNAERLAEIRELAKRAPWGSLPMVNELIGHIAQLEARITGLEFANGVLDSAAKDAQAWQYEAQTAKEAYTELLEANRVTEAEGGAVAQLNGMIDELRARLEAQRGGAVVVAAWDVNAFALASVKAGAYAEGDLRDALKNAETGYNFAVSRIQPIPASQVLQPGEVGVDREELMYLHAFEKYARKHGPESIQDVVGTLDHLRRAQQAKGE